MTALGFGFVAFVLLLMVRIATMQGRVPLPVLQNPNRQPCRGLSVETLTGLKQWIRCLAGLHEWVCLDDTADGSHTFCLWCGAVG